jgi:hypothetical protein
MARSLAVLAGRRILPVLGFLLLVSGCTVSASRQAGPPATIVGYIERLDAGDGVLRMVTLKQRSGQIRTFEVATDRPLNVDLQHLEIHRLTNTPVTLRLQLRAGVQRVVAIDD